MKIQDLAIIFIIIILPISIVISVITQLQIQTINIQSVYDSKLTSATYDAMRAFQINTEYNTGSDITESKKRDLEASIRSFRDSLTAAFNLDGYTENDINNYIPALVYTLYDGFYIYSPYVNLNYRYEPQIESDGSVKKDAEGNIIYDESKPKDGNGDNIYGLKPYMSYSCRYKKDNDNDVVITYALDNYITVQGIIGGVYYNRSGYLIDNINVQGGKGDYTDTVKYNGVEIKNEQITEYFPGTGDAGIPYVKLNGTKYYLIESLERIAYINNNGILTTHISREKNEKDYLKMVALIKNNWMAKEYYREADVFTEWFKETLGPWNISYNDAYGQVIDGEGNITIGKLWDGDTRKIFEFNDGITYSKNIESELSSFNQHRLAIIRHNIEINLAIAISNYNSYFGLGETRKFEMPELKEEEWECITHNISLISFLQGLPVGNKTYNGYTVVTNSKSKEVVLEQNIYILGSDDNYHKIGDKVLEKGESVTVSSWYSNGQSNAGRLNLDFDRKRAVTINEKDFYYYPLRRFNASYNSVVMQGKFTAYDDIYQYVNDRCKDEVKEAFYTAIGRERYGTFKTLSAVNVDNVYKDSLMYTISYEPNADDVVGMPDTPQLITLGGDPPKISEKRPSREGWEFRGWSTSSSASDGESAYAPGAPYKGDSGITLYAIWKRNSVTTTSDKIISNGIPVSDSIRFNCSGLSNVQVKFFVSGNPSAMGMVDIDSGSSDTLMSSGSITSNTYNVSVDGKQSIEIQYSIIRGMGEAWVEITGY